MSNKSMYTGLGAVGAVVGVIAVIIYYSSNKNPDRQQELAGPTGLQPNYPNDRLSIGSDTSDTSETYNPSNYRISYPNQGPNGGRKRSKKRRRHRKQKTKSHHRK
jgi:hypothetical protein